MAFRRRKRFGTFEERTPGWDYRLRSVPVFAYHVNGCALSEQKEAILLN